MTDKIIAETYIGDGVYASVDGYQIKLRTEWGGEEDIIYIDPSVWCRLKEFAKHCGMEPKDTDNG